MRHLIITLLAAASLAAAPMDVVGWHNLTQAQWRTDPTALWSTMPLAGTFTIANPQPYLEIRLQRDTATLPSLLVLAWEITPQRPSPGYDWRFAWCAGDTLEVVLTYGTLSPVDDIPAIIEESPGSDPHGEPVPEPGGWILALIGLGIMALRPLRVGSRSPKQPR